MATPASCVPATPKLDRQLDELTWELCGAVPGPVGLLCGVADMIEFGPPSLDLSDPNDLVAIGMMTDGGRGRAPEFAAERLALRGDGKVHGPIPDHVPDNWSKDDLEQVKSDLETSIATRKEEQERLGEDPQHRWRLTEEEQLLKQIEKKLSGS